MCNICLLADTCAFMPTSQSHNYLFQHHQVARPTAAPSTTVTSSSAHIPVRHTSPPSLRGMPPDHQNTSGHNASHMKGVFLPTSSPYDVSPVDRSQTSAIIGDGREMQNDPLLGGAINTVDNRQVRFWAS